MLHAKVLLFAIPEPIGNQIPKTTPISHVSLSVYCPTFIFSVHFSKVESVSWVGLSICPFLFSYWMQEMEWGGGEVVHVEICSNMLFEAISPTSSNRNLCMSRLSVPRRLDCKCHCVQTQDYLDESPLQPRPWLLIAKLWVAKDSQN